MKHDDLLAVYQRMLEWIDRRDVYRQMGKNKV